MNRTDIQSLINSFNRKMESRKYSLSKEDLHKIAKGAGIAMGGALITYLAQMLGQVDFGAYTPLAVAIASIVVNAVDKWQAQSSR